MADTRKQADEAAKAQEALEMEVSRCLMGQSQFTAEMLSKLIEQAAQKHKALNHTAAELEQKLADQKKIADGVQTYYDRFLGWSMEFGMASLARKRIIMHSFSSALNWIAGTICTLRWTGTTSSSSTA